MDTLSAEKRAVDATDALDKKKSIVIDVRDHEAQLVDVSGENNVQLFVRSAETREGIAIGIGRKFVAMRFHVFGPDALGAGFEAGGRRSDDEIFEKLERGFIHDRTMQTQDGGGKTSTAEKRSGTMRHPR
jgi:hypothetical protein